MKITSQIGNVIYATTPGFDALMDDDLETAEDFMSRASKLITGNCDFVVGSPEVNEITHEDEGRTAKIPCGGLPCKVYAIVNETGGITYMLAEEY